MIVEYKYKLAMGTLIQLQVCVIEALISYLPKMTECWRPIDFLEHPQSNVRYSSTTTCSSSTQSFGYSTVLELAVRRITLSSEYVLDCLQSAVL